MSNRGPFLGAAQGQLTRAGLEVWDDAGAEHGALAAAVLHLDIFCPRLLTAAAAGNTRQETLCTRLPLRRGFGDIPPKTPACPHL